MLNTLFKSQAAVKILDVMLDLPEITMSKSLIARQAKVTWKTVDSYMPVLLKRKIVKRQGKGFKVIPDSPMMEALIRLDNAETAIMVN